MKDNILRQINKNANRNITYIIKILTIIIILNILILYDYFFI